MRDTALISDTLRRQSRAATRARVEELRTSARGLGISPAALARMRQGRRAYAQGAVVDRLNTDWRINSASGNQEVRADIRELRRRARALFRDDAHVNAAVREFAQNIVGDEGIRLHPKNEGADGKPAEKANKAIARAWKDWGHKETASIDQRKSWIEQQVSFVEDLIVDGEVFIRQHTGFRNAYGYALEQIDPDLLDETLNREADRNGNAIVMGIEIDRFGAPLFYHFWTRHPAEAGPRERIPIPANEIIHWMKSKRAKQVRGVSWLTPILFRLKQLGAYEDAEITGARIGASQMGFFEWDIEHLEHMELPEPNQQLTMEIAPGMFETLPPGLKLTKFDPAHPNTAFDTFVKSILRAVAAGLGLAYTTLTGDLNGVSYSSGRIGLLSERAMWRRLQRWMAETIHRQVYRGWLSVALLSPKLNLPSPIADRWLDVSWHAIGWPWVDPLKEIQAHEMAIALGVDSRTRICTERGLDYEDVLRELAREQELAEQHGVFIDGIAAKKDTPHPVDENEMPGTDAADGADATTKKPALAA